MSGSNDALAQMLLMQARQSRQPSTQARLAQQMMAANMQQAQTPIWGTGATLARAGSGVLAGLMAGMAERSDRQREEQDFERMQQYQTQREEAANLRINNILAAAGIGIPGMAPAAAPQMAPPSAAAPSMPATNDPGVASTEAHMPPGQPRYNPATARNTVDENGNDWAPELRGQPWDAGLRPPTGRTMPLNPENVPPPRPGVLLPSMGGAAPAAVPQGRPAQPNYDAAALALALDPATRHLAPVIGQIAQRNQPNLANASPGTTIYDQRTGRPVATVPEEVTWTAPVDEVRNGQPVRVQYSNRGTERVVPNAAPFVAPSTRDRNLGTTIEPVDVRTGLPVAPPRPVDVQGVEAGQAAGRAIGQQTGTDVAGAPQTVRAAEQTLSLIDGVLNHGALSTATGMLAPLGGIPGTPQFDFSQRVAQLQGRAFLDAFESLRGGGAITQIEGEKATQAIARLNRAASARDFREALQELRGIVEDGRARAAARLPAQATLPGGQAVDPPRQTQQQPISEGTTIVNPQTGERLRMRDGQWVPAR